MTLIKKNILSIVCGVVIILALVALLWPLGGMTEDFEQTLEQRKATYTKLNGFLSETRTQPVVELESDDPVPLEQFPGPKVIEAGEQVTKEVATQSAKMQAEAVEMNRHELLVPRSLPRPSNKQRFDFRDAYRRVIYLELPTNVLRATMPPTDEDIQAAEDELWESDFKQKIHYRIEKDDKGKETRIPLNEERVREEFAVAIEDLPEKIRKKRAQEFLMYMEPGAIEASVAILDETRAFSPADMWYAQVALWVQDDVCRSIARMNGGARSLLDAPVKQLVALAVPPDVTLYALPATAGRRGEESEAPVADLNAPLAQDFTVSPTGRVSNALYDVVHFTIEVIMDPRYIPPFVQELSRPKINLAPDGSVAEREPCTFITVNRLDMATVDKALALQESGFAYGDAPVARVTLECESIFLRAWTIPYMPPEVSQTLGIQPPDDTADGQVSLR